MSHSIANCVLWLGKRSSSGTTWTWPCATSSLPRSSPLTHSPIQTWSNAGSSSHSPSKVRTPSSSSSSSIIMSPSCFFSFCSSRSGATLFALDPSSGSGRLLRHDLAGPMPAALPVRGGQRQAVDRRALLRQHQEHPPQDVQRYDVPAIDACFRGFLRFPVLFFSCSSPQIC